MVGFCISGGIGDAILLSAVIREIKRIFLEVEVAVFDPNIVIIIESLGVKCHLVTSFTKYSTSKMVLEIHNFLKSRGADLAIWNCFRTDHNGNCNFFISLQESTKKFVEEKCDLYYENLSICMGKKIHPAKKDGFNIEIAKFLCLESDYFSDWKRYGINVCHKDVYLFSPLVENKKLDDLKPYCVIHDSKLRSNFHSDSIKSWSIDKWDSVCELLFGKINLIHFHDRNQKLFNHCISSFDVLPKDPIFWDYLDLIKRSSLYIGTDSWPGHAAIFAPNNFIILKGAVSYRWDHNSKYSLIIRKGNCQCCEYLSLEKCIFRNGEKCCMGEIKINDVKEKLNYLLK